MTKRVYFSNFSITNTGRKSAHRLHYSSSSSVVTRGSVTVLSLLGLLSDTVNSPHTHLFLQTSGNRLWFWGHISDERATVRFMTHSCASTELQRSQRGVKIGNTSLTNNNLAFNALVLHDKLFSKRGDDTAAGSFCSVRRSIGWIARSLQSVR